MEKIMTTKNNIIDTNNCVTADELYDILNMQLDRIESNPDDVGIMAPCMIWGSPGCGKSSVVRSVCKDRGIDFIDVRLTQMEPCDIKGLPVPNRETNTMDWFVNGSWPRKADGKGIIFLDELSSADRSIACAAYELVLDRRLGKLYSVPPGYLIVAAGNKVTDRAIANTISSALANRFMHVELKDDSETWLTWGRNNNIHPAVLGYIAYKPSMLFSTDGENLSRGWPTPRSWERVSQLCHMYNDKSDSLLRKMVYGTVGNGAGCEFMEFYKTSSEFDNILDIMVDPKSKIVIPDRADRKYAMCSAMVYLLWRGKSKEDEAARINGFYRIGCELSSDFASMALLAAITSKDNKLTSERCNKLMLHPMFAEWQKKHGNSLKKGLAFKNAFK